MSFILCWGNDKSEKQNLKSFKSGTYDKLQFNYLITGKLIELIATIAITSNKFVFLYQLLRQFSRVIFFFSQINME